jgi:2-C-methyl-D-erythritol 4-phosphate cytidylyltransferase
VSVSAPVPAACPAPKVWTVVVAAGASTRFGRPKLLEIIDGVRVIDHSIAAARRSTDGVILVTSSDQISAGVDVDVVVAGGSTRSESVRAGLAALPADVEYVLVHDGARPGADSALFRRVIDALHAGADAVVPGIVVTDTIKQVDGNVVVGTVDRSSLVAVQTPQGFAVDKLRSAHASQGDATDDAGLIEDLGGVVVVVEGDEANAKITTERDLVIARATWPPASSDPTRQPVDVPS